MRGYAKVCIIILNWNGLEDTIECLESLRKITYPNYEVIVVDNGSKGNDVAILKERFGDYIHIIRNDKNYGFAEGANIGIRYVLENQSPDYILLLNNDTVLDTQFLTSLIKVANNEPQIGIVGPKIYYYYEPNRIWFGGGKINLLTGKTYHLYANQTDVGQANQVKEVDYITGCSLLIKREVVERIGLFDPEYFSYFEETDFCIRASKAGYKMVFVPDAKVWHKVSASTAGEFSPVMAYYFVRNRFLFMMKRGSPLMKSRLVFVIFYLGYILRKILVYSLRGKPRVVKAIIKGAVDGFLVRKSF